MISLIAGTAFRENIFGRGDYDFLPITVQCRGHEQTLLNCFHGDIDTGCTTGGSAGVVCSNGKSF